jgi:hypothetical protein
MQTYTTTIAKNMPKTPAAATERVRHALADLGVRPLGFAFNVAHVATGRHLERVVVCLPLGHYDEGQAWFDKLRDVLPWGCRVTLVPEIGRIEIAPRGQ